MNGYDVVQKNNVRLHVTSVWLSPKGRYRDTLLAYMGQVALAPLPPPGWPSRPPCGMGVGGTAAPALPVGWDGMGEFIQIC